MPFEGGLPIVIVRIMDIQQLQAVITEARQINHMIMQLWPECTWVFTEHRWHISIYHHIRKSFDNGNSEYLLLKTQKMQIKHMLYMYMYLVVLW